MIPLFSPIAANANLDYWSAIKRVFDRHWYILGEEVRGFEHEFAIYVGVSHCLTLANGTDALEIGLRALGVAPGDKVVTVANAGFYSSTAIRAIGALPLYVDIDPETLTMSVSALDTAIQEKPRAIIVTHLYGQIAEIGLLTQLAGEAGIPLVEDCAQAHGARLNGRMVGSFGALGCFSFYPTKNLGAIGDGGAICTNDEALADRVRSLRQYGWGAKYDVALPGGRNSRLDEVQAAVLRLKLPYLDKWNNERRKIAERYNEAFASLSKIILLPLGHGYVAHLYVIRLPERESFRQFLLKRGIATDVHYPIPDHLQQAYWSVNTASSLSVTEKSCSQVVSLPCFPGLSTGEIDTIISAVCDWHSR